MVQQWREELAERTTVETEPQAIESGFEVSAQIASELKRVVRKHDGIDRVEQESLLIGPVPVDRRACDARLL